MKFGLTFCALLKVLLCVHSEANDKVDAKISIDLATTHQTFQGFGSFSGDPKVVANHPKKEEFLDLLYGEDGLQLSVIRSWIPPNITMSELKNTTELWMQLQAKEKYGVKKFIASTWSPPYDWKSRKGQKEGKNMNYLKEEHYQDFANYMADFAEEHKKLGLELYSMSPQNEPEYPTTAWDGCVWLPHQTAKFVKNYLKPTLVKRQLNTKIMIGETANWNVANLYLVTTSALLKDTDFDVYASHGYSFPQFPQFKIVQFNQRVIPWLSPALFKKERWITEASSIDKYDSTINKGIQLATSIIKFLTNGNVNGYTFWYSVIAADTNEGLIVSDNKGGYQLPKMYDVYGQFTRHIKEGQIRVKTTKSWRSSSDIEVVTFKDELKKRFVTVLVNQGSRTLNCNIKLEKQKISSHQVNATITSETQKWFQTQFPVNNGNSILIPMQPKSVVTVFAEFQ